MQWITPPIRWLLVVLIHWIQIDLLDSAYYVLIDWDGGLDRKIFGPRSWRTVLVPWLSAKHFRVQPDLTQSITNSSYEHCTFPSFFLFFRVTKFAIGIFTYMAHFDWKVGIYTASKLFQFASCKELYTILAGPDSFFWPCLHHRVQPSYRDFLNSFAMKTHAGPYRSYDNTIVHIFLIHWNAWKKPNNLGLRQGMLIYVIMKIVESKWAR